MTEPNDAARALDAFSKGPAIEAADDLAQAFELAGDRIANAFERAARSGEFSFNALAESVSRDLARLAINELVTAPLQSLVSDIGKGLTGSSANSKPPITVNMTINSTGSSAGLKQSEAQIATRLAQAVARGQARN
ncbi:phage tail tape measure C-terminal domain-containing protein [Litorimonas sp. RW-G-Af-16]|uniref:phage tail tape measure C-terminal domain-containing protein n=1 Tax=Litorimonas sp. RW-G-Af-16 TaxID=3241168 RepID=UPI00390CD772